MKKIYPISGAIIVILLLLGYFFLWPFVRGIRPAFLPASQDKEETARQVQENQMQTQFGQFMVDAAFTLEVFAKDVINPRVMIFDEAGNMIVSEPSASRVSYLTPQGERKTLLEKLDQPHGLALHAGKLYVAETGQVLQFDYDAKAGQTSNRLVLLDLPSGSGHWTRTLGFGPDEKLYISVGSSCNICLEKDWRRTKILQYDLGKQELKEFASGLRNAVFFTWHPESEEMYVTEMGRDLLGDGIPPDELNIVKQGIDYGFPYCYGQNNIDPEFNNFVFCRDSAQGSLYDFKAHEAPLGLAFYGDDQDLIVALHGSWNRSQPIGYEVIRLLAKDNYQTRQTVMTGFLQSNGSAIGRPAGVVVGPDNNVYISDDKAGIIYRLKPR